MKFADPRLNLSREIAPEAVWGGIFDGLRNFDNSQPEIVRDFISGMAVQFVGVDMCQFWWFYIESVGGVIFDRFSNVDNFRPEVDRDR